MILSGVQSVSTYTDDNHILFLDALQVLTRRQRLHQEPQVAEAPIVEHPDAPIPFALQGEQRQGEVPSPLVDPIDFEDLFAVHDDPILLSRIKDVQSSFLLYETAPWRKKTAPWCKSHV